MEVIYLGNKFYVPKTLGYQVANCIRQFALTEVEFPRIVGFSLGDSNLLRSGKFDLCQVSSNLSNIEIKVEGYEEFPIVIDVPFNDVLTIGHLRKAGIGAIGDDEDILLSVPDSSSKTIKLIINSLKSNTSAADNRSLLESKLPPEFLDRCNIIHSRGSNFDFGINVVPGISADIVTVDAKTPDSRHVLEQSLKSIIHHFCESLEETLN